MAYQSNDKQEEFATVEKGGRGEFIRVTRITPENRKRGEPRHPNDVYGGKSRYGNGIAPDPEGSQNANFDSGRGFGGCAKGIVAFGARRGLAGARVIKAP